MIGSMLGGVGLFLLGMILLTDGLKTAAGDALRKALARFTGGRFSALVSGATLTAMVQSSSATTLATIGFVSAGILTFEQAVGVIFGANLGTTSTGWLVSLLGFKVSVAAFALPLVGVGALPISSATADGGLPAWPWPGSVSSSWGSTSSRSAWLDWPPGSTLRCCPATRSSGEWRSWGWAWS